MKYPVLQNRMDIIGPLVKDKSVLDVGCVDHDIKQIQGSWMHREIARLATEVLGVDHLPEAVQELQKLGFKVVCQNAETLNLDKTFDVIVAGEIIEHLKNPGLFLEGVAKHLRPGGTLVLTTPNAFSVANVFKILKRNAIKVNSDHTCWYDPVTIQTLLGKCGFKAEEIYWINDFKRFRLRSFWAKLRPYFSDTFLLIAKKA